MKTVLTAILIATGMVSAVQAQDAPAVPAPPPHMVMAPANPVVQQSASAPNAYSPCKPAMADECAEVAAKPVHSHAASHHHYRHHA